MISLCSLCPLWLTVFIRLKTGITRPSTIFPAAKTPQRRIVATPKTKNSRDMFSRAAPVVVEEIKNAEALFGDNTRQHNPADAQENWGCNYLDTGSPCRLRRGPQKGE
jgi:hypothetical protein